MKISVYIACSLDGYIARNNGELDWLINSDTTIEGEDYGYDHFFSSVSCLVMGSNSLEKVLSFPEWPYNGKRVVVLSQSLKSLPNSVVNKAELFSGSIEELVEKLENQGEKNLYVDGGLVIQSFLRLGFIDRLIVTRVPILIGSGLPLFGQLSVDIKLEHVETKVFSNGLVQSEYRRKIIAENQTIMH